VELGLRVAALTRFAGIPADAAALDLRQAASLDVQLRTGGRPSSVQQNVPAWLIFGMFLVVMPISALFILERRDGTLARLASLQVPFSLLLLGKIGPYFVVNLAQALLMFAAGKTLVPWFGGESLALPERWDLLAIVTACTSLTAIGSFSPPALAL
jgi:ABC-2 type transport system permease protein